MLSVKSIKQILKISVTDVSKPHHLPEKNLIYLKTGTLLQVEQLNYDAF